MASFKRTTGKQGLVKFKIKHKSTSQYLKISTHLRSDFMVVEAGRVSRTENIMVLSQKEAIALRDHLNEVLTGKF
jgi:uncharacterized protein YueI